MTQQPILEIRNLRVGFPVHAGFLHRAVGELLAVDGVSFVVHEGETLGLVGESGCGKSTLTRTVLGIQEAMAPGVRITGEILFRADEEMIDLRRLSPAAMRPLRSQIQIVFQDPYSSLNPRIPVGKQIEAPLRIHTTHTPEERSRRVGRLLEQVGLQPQYATRYPHEFSGGQRQRIGIARALALQPKLIVLDEPVSALDVSVQAQVINLLQDLQDELGLAYLFVAHDLSVVQHVSDRVAVMYLGNIVEIGDADTVCDTPAHPYSKALLSAVPHPDPREAGPPRIRLNGEIPSPSDKPSGCGFRTRCPIAREECAAAVPPLQLQKTGQLAACPYCRELVHERA